MPYYLSWVLLVMISLWAALGGFLWALSHGQFSDQNRARYLPLRDESLPFKKPAPKLTREVYALLVLLGAGAVLMVSVFWVILSHQRG